MKLSIIAPCYNEEESLKTFYKWNKDVLEDLDHDYEIVLVNDGSSDNTGKILDELADMDPKVKVVHFRRNFGQTAAMMAGIDHASGDIIIPMDSDLQNDPKDIPRLLEKMDEGYEVVSGWRKNRKDNALKRNLPSKIANWLISKLSGVYLHDYGCSLKAYRKDVIKGVKLYGEMHRFIPIYASWFGAKVTEIPVTHHERKYGQSKYGINRTIKVVLDLIVIKFLEGYSQKPIYLFGGFGIISFFLAFVSGLFMLYFKFWGNKSFVETPLPQLVVILSLIGFLSILIGLVAEMLNRTYHESQNKPVYIVKKTKNMKEG